MSTEQQPIRTWTPGKTRVERTVERVVERSAFENPLAQGTRVRATLGPSVIYGTVREPDGNSFYPHLDLSVEGANSGEVFGVTLWIGLGWAIEVLEEAPGVK